MASTEKDSDMAEREMETAEKMVEDSETNPDLAQTTKEISETKVSDSIDKDSDLTKYKLVKSPTEPNQSTQDEYETLKFQVYKFFKENPETEEEKNMKELDIHSQIKTQHEKCRELQELALGNTKTFKLMKKCSLRFSKELSVNHTFQELTNEAENLMLEYGMCVDIDSLRREQDPREQEGEMLLDMALELPNQSSYADAKFETPVDFRPLEDCVRDVLIVHLSAAGEEKKVRKRIKVQARALEDSKARKKANEEETSGLDVKEKEMLSNMEISDDEDSNTKKKPRPRRCYYRVYLDEEILNHRINFLMALQEMIRSSLRLFRRFNKAWLKPGETLIERTLEQVKKQFIERRDTIDKRYYWNDWRSDVKGGDEETCQPNRTTGSVKETTPADEKGASYRSPSTSEIIEDLLALRDNKEDNREDNWEENVRERVKALMNEYRKTLAARSVPAVAEAITNGSVLVPKATDGSVPVVAEAITDDSVTIPKAADGSVTVAEAS